MNSVGRVLVVMAGIFVGQALLYGPSLVGQKVLLPLDILALPGEYLPQTLDAPAIYSHDRFLADLVNLFEPARCYAVSELRAGRFPLWDPMYFLGSPFITIDYSPCCVLNYCIASPVVLAWTQVIQSLVAGMGAYLFFRRATRLGFWPSAIAAWCYPLTGFFILWQGFPLTSVATWLPWILLAVDTTVRRSLGFGSLALASTTCFTIISGRLDIAGQVLLASGIYGVWCWIDEYRGDWLTRRAILAGVAVTIGWGAGFCLAAPQLLPFLEYSQSGSRMMRRSQGDEERPPIGISALPQVVLPDMYGRTQYGWCPLSETNRIESSAAAYAGLWAALVAAPLAWCSRRHRSSNIFWLALGFFALTWLLDVPGFVALLRLPVLNMMSHNRFVFVTSFAILALAATGLDAIERGVVARRWWFWIPAALLAILCWSCLDWMLVPPEPLASLAKQVEYGGFIEWIHDAAGVRLAQETMTFSLAVAAAMTAVGVGVWLWLWFRPKTRPWVAYALGAFLVGDLLWYGFGVTPQCDWSLYYPRLPILDKLSKEPPGRILCINCLPATVAHSHDLPDVRGYDGIDPARLTEVMDFAAATNSTRHSYAMTQWYVPNFVVGAPGLIRLPPVLDMMNIRYVVFQGSPTSGIQPDFLTPGYWALINRNAAPRVLVPSQVETIVDPKERLARLASDDFDPLQTAFVEEPVELPTKCRGSAEIVGDAPTRVTVTCKMETAGLVVLADRWDKGWRAYWDGKPVAILPTNHTIRGVVVPSGKGTLEFRYEPASLAWGWRLCGFAVVALAGWSWFCTRRRDA